MKLANYIAQRLSQKTAHVFCVSGSASLHLIHAIADTDGIAYICPQHEQAAGFAADAYARLHGFGCALATSGPGATNLLTAIAASWADSVPVLYITGQVITTQMKGNARVRQMGFQETDIVSMSAPVTKLARQVTRADEIAEILDQAMHCATSGRPGPVLIDIPDDLQRAEINPMKLWRWSAPVPEKTEPDIKIMASSLRHARRPLLIIGNGARKALKQLDALVHALQLPYVTTWPALDLSHHRHHLFVGGFGTHANRAANRAVQAADCILSLGARLDTKATGADASRFAPAAKIFMVDIDPSEIAKMITRGRQVIGTCASAEIVIEQLLATKSPRQDHLLNDDWLQQICDWKIQDWAYPSPSGWNGNPCELMRTLGDISQPNDIITADTGYTICWLAQAFPFGGQRLLHAFGNTPMGYGLPAAIGAAMANPGKRIICISGDGSFQMSSAELATVARHQLPIRIILLNNGGHAMCRQTQDRWLGGAHHATSIDGGLGFPDFIALARANGINALRLEKGDNTRSQLTRLLEAKGPALLEVSINPDAGLPYQVPFGKSLHEGA